MPEVSVIIPVHDPGPWLVDALASVRGQRFTDHEIVVVDDASTQDLSWLTRDHPDVRVVRQPHGGASVARNRGVLVSTAPLVAFMDQDDLWTTRKLDHQVSAMARYPGAGVAFCGLRVFRDPSEAQLTDVGEAEPPMDRVLAPRGGPIGPRLAAALEAFGSNFVVPSTVMVRREVLASTGLFDPWSPFTGDFDLLLRLGAVAEVIEIDSPDVWYRQHDSNFTLRYEVGRRELARMRRHYADLARAEGDERLRRQVDRTLRRPRRLYAYQALDRARVDWRSRDVVASSGHLARSLLFDPRVLTEAVGQRVGVGSRRGTGPQGPPAERDSVALVLPSFEPFGSATGALAIIARHLARELTRLGTVARVVGPAPTEAWTPDVEAALIPTSGRARRLSDRLGSNLGGSARSGRYLADVSRRLEGCATVVVLNDIDLAVALQERTGRRTFVFAQNQIRPVDASAKQLRRLDGWLGCSPFICTWAVAEHQLSPERVHVVPNGVDLDQFRGGPRQPHDGLRAGFVGRMDPNKGVMELLDAVAEVRGRGIDISLELAGPIMPWGLSPPQRPAFERGFATAVATAGARYRGPIGRAATARLMADADVVFVPSVSDEPFGLVSVEAMACGAATVVSDRGALPWIVADAALVVEPTRQALAAAIERLASDPHLVEDLGRRGRARAAHFSWDRSAAALLSAIAP